MMFSGRFHILAAAFVAVLFISTGRVSYAQFKSEAFKQNYNEQTDTTGKVDTTDKMFSIKEYFGALGHKNTTKIGSMFAGSTVFIGGCQIYNKDYWKLPVVYGGIGVGAGLGGYFLSRYNKSKIDGAIVDNKAGTIGKLCIAGAGLVYWWALMDGVKNYDDGRDPHPGKATLYSVLCPGLGQAYNGEYWKIPIYVGGLVTAGHFLYTTNTNYQKYRHLYIDISSGLDPDSPITAENAKYYRDSYRRLRDYSILATAAVYLLQIIDANVFSYMYDFEVTDDISLNVQPALIPQGNSYAFSPRGNAVGMSIGLNF